MPIPVVDTMKRYEKYKDSGVEWIGEIPEHWSLKKIKYAVEINPEVLPEGTDENLEIQYIDIGNVEHGKLKFPPELWKFGAAPSRARRIIKLGDTIVSTVRTYLKAITFIDNESENLICSTGFAVLRTKFDLGEKFLFYVISCEEIIEEICSLSVGVSYPAINPTILGGINIWHPPLPEQTTIADFLDRKTAELDSLIEKKARLIQLYEEEKAAMINQAVTKGLDPHVNMKPSGIEWLGNIPAHWEVKRLKYVAKINPTKDITIDRESFELVVFLPMEKVKENGDIDCELMKPISVLWNGFTFFKKNDVIVAKITPCFENGKGALLNKLRTEIGFGSTEFHVLRAGKSILPEFLYFITKSEIFMKIGEAFMTGAAGQKRVPTDFISEFIFALPSPIEQLKVVNHIETECARIDAIIAKFRKQIVLFKEYRTTLISEVVTGKIDVRDERATTRTT